MSTIESCGTHILTSTPSSGGTSRQVPSSDHNPTQFDIPEALTNSPIADQRMEGEVHMDPKEPFDYGTK